MSSKHIHGDLNFAWPSAEIAVMGPQGAVDILFKAEIKAAADPKKAREKLIDEYSKKFANPYQAAERGYIDEVIDAGQSRAKLVRAFHFLRNKKVETIKKKHGNIPL